jgi:translation initiation factor IF-3
MSSVRNRFPQSKHNHKRPAIARRQPIRPQRVQEDRPRLNNEIRAPRIRLIKPDGEHEITSSERALELADRFNLDLVEIAPDAEPPVCKIMDFGKYLFEKKKKEREAKKKQHVIQIKELRFRPHTDDHDMEFKTRHAREFLQSGDKVKATVQFRGRDMMYAERGEVLLNQLADSLKDISKIESKPSIEGRRMMMILAPSKG